MNEIFKGTAGRTTHFALSDAAGQPVPGLVFGDITASYTRTRSAPVAITPATQTVTGAWASGGFVEVDAATQPGVYRFDVPNAAYATGAEEVVITIMAPSIVTAHKLFNLIAWDKQVAVFPAVNQVNTVAVVTDKTGYSLTPESRGLIATDVWAAAPEATPLADIAAAVWDELIETGVSAKQALAVIGAATAGKASGLATTTAVYYAMGASGTTTARISAVVDADGNRTATTLTLPA